MTPDDASPVGEGAESPEPGGEARGFDFAAPPLPGQGADLSHTPPPPVASAASPLPNGEQAGGKRRPRRGRSTRTARSGRRRSNGRWVLVTMIAAMGLIIGGGAWAAVLAHQSSGVTPAAQGTTGTLHTGQVISGMCLKDAPDADADAGPVRVVRCDEAHHAEALVAYTFTSGEWPGEAAARDEVTAFCAAQVDPDAGAVPVSPDAPPYEWLAWVPSEGTWGHGDRTGLCIITMERPIAGSYGAGTARDAAEDAVVG